MFDLGGDQVLAFTTIEIGNALDRQVVRFGGTGGPDDLARIGIDQLGDLATAVFHSLLSLPTKYMGTRRRVTEVAIHQQTLTHFLRDTRIDRRCCGIIEVNRQFH
ncbi:hypothetical protein D9M68_907880 [compost metagenome]